MEPGPTPILELIDGFRRSKTLFAAVELGIFDGARPRGASLDRLLEACAFLGLLEKRGEDYSNTPASDRFLRSSSPESLAGYIRYANSTLYPLWGHLEGAVIEGTPRWRRAFGFKGVGALTRLAWRVPGLSRLFKAQQGRSDFNAGMHAFGLLTSPLAAAALDLSRFRRLADLGGSTGHLAMAVQQRYPAMEICVFDLPEAVAAAKPYAREHTEFISGDFFKDPLPPADLYALGKVLHNLPDQRAIFLLKRIYQALPAAGALLVVERLLEEDRLGPSTVHLQSLNMLVATGGRERTFSEYRTLLEKSGFASVQLERTGGITDAILAVKNPSVG